ncbi:MULTISPECIES: tetratricopeptide repeat protein [unclassified Streptomyces]|uniref:tetratricopeptide repeat protein n=1 Tax=unclassified Streptomyces TaxID=2593676 RepID=UPI002DDA86FC|nr:tetratricopeptide repeat protein [Streptomyces sp. NBC_01750]WSB05028.1 tetratricopeptide repeat protein [Streptomyces sp. NBC_01794]WSD30700.1 tetratricopeptide repeat protein [Streptomyces sp. NBC_01750]
MPRSQELVLDRLLDLFEVGEYEEAEAGARALAAAPRRVWGRSPIVVWLAKAIATAAAGAHGRGTEVLAELETLIAVLERTVGAERALLLVVRGNRVAVLVGQGRYTEAEAEAQDILRAAARLAHLTEVWRVELSCLKSLASALCGQGRYEEAEAIARGNLPRAEGHTAAALHCVLVRSLNGQGRHEEALAETRRLTPLWVRSGSGALGMATATALHGLGRRGEAEAAARQALAACEQFLHPAHPRIQDARALLARTTAEGPLS